VTIEAQGVLPHLERDSRVAPATVPGPRAGPRYRRRRDLSPGVAQYAGGDRPALGGVRVDSPEGARPPTAAAIRRQAGEKSSILSRAMAERTAPDDQEISFDFGVQVLISGMRAMLKR
jgi:hypothetical protein